MSEQTWRLLLDSPAIGAWNMAVDDAVLDSVANGASPPTLRFYGWRPACLSLGYFQSYAVVDAVACRALGIDVVRRPTGGRAILHDRELTYSIALPASVLGHDRGILPSYYRISRALQAGLASLGVETTTAPESATTQAPEHGPICFDQPSAHEILLQGRKLVGSAQVRRGNALLQHGSILIQSDMRTMLKCLRLRAGQAGDPTTVENGVIGLAAVGIVDATTIRGPIATGIAAEFGLELKPGGLSDAERRAVAQLTSSKYQSAVWTERPLDAVAEKTTRTR